MIRKPIASITYSPTSVMIITFVDNTIPNEEWNLAYAAVPIGSNVQAPYVGPENVSPERRRGIDEVYCSFVYPGNLGRSFTVDIKDVNGGADYATVQDLIDEIVANIPNGGGGGGVASVSADAPLDSSGGANPTISIDTTGASAGDVMTFDGADVVFSAPAGGITSINLNVGPAIELRIPLDAMWAQINNAGAPAAGEFEANSNVDATAVTSLTFHILDAGTNDQSAFFASMRIGGLITGRQTDNDGTNTSGSPCIYRITAAPTLASSRYTIAVAHVSGVFQGSFPNWYVSYAGNAQVPVINTTAAPTAIHCVVTGTTDGTGRVTVDFTAASGNRPAFSAVHFVGGSGTTGGNQLTAYIQDETLSAYIVQFWNLQAAGEDSGGSTVSFVILGIPA